MKMECEIGMVIACQVQECSYNENRECHAGKIQVGDVGTHAACDTFTTAQVEEQGSQVMVENCDVSKCKFNEHMMCRAPAVSLGHHETHAECDSYVPEMM
jgi:hypothetical protein